MKKFKRVFIESDSDYSNASGMEVDSGSQKYGEFLKLTNFLLKYKICSKC